MVLSIKNVKTEKTEKQTEVEWAEANAHKQRLLTMTDWTQLSDVYLREQDDIRQWRNEVRNLDLRKDFKDPRAAKCYLVQYEKTFPECSMYNPEDNKTPLEMSDHEIDKLYNTVESLEKKIKKLEQKIKASDEKQMEELYIDISQSKEKIWEHLVEEKNNNLISAGTLEYPLMINKMEQAIDYLSSDNPDISEYNLLNNTGEVSELQYVESVLQDCRKYFKQLYNIENDYLQKKESVYNMSIEDINDWFITNGYRYRCSDHN